MIHPATQYGLFEVAEPIPVEHRASVSSSSKFSDYEDVGLKIYPPQKAKSPGEPTEAVTPTRNPQSILISV
jgi:hypothetical protein